jgi:FtsH-binding integral membrane protein
MVDIDVSRVFTWLYRAALFLIGIWIGLIALSLLAASFDLGDAGSILIVAGFGVLVPILAYGLRQVMFPN